MHLEAFPASAALLTRDGASAVASYGHKLVAPAQYTSRIQKGGAMLEEMRHLVRIWTDASVDANRSDVVRLNPLNKATRARVLDVINRIFVPRFVAGPIPESWRLLVPLEQLNASTPIVKPLYFWLTASADPLVYDFCCDYLANLRLKGVRKIDVADAASWIASKGNRWSETVIIKVTRALLAALRDFGVLEGKAKKQVAFQQLPLPSFSYLAFSLHHHLKVPARQLASHPDGDCFCSFLLMWNTFFSKRTRVAFSSTTSPAA